MSKKSKVFFLTLIILSLALTFMLADLFSTFLTVGNFAFLPSQGIKASAYKIYAISLKKSATNAEANTNVKEIKTRGGAGYVYATNGLYYVLASAYENENDASNVQSNLKESNTESELLEIAVGQIALDITLSGTEKNAINEAILSFKNTFKTLYDISISLDTSVKDLATCKLELSTAFDTNTKIRSAFESAFKSKLSSEIFKIRLKLIEQTNIIQALVELDFKEKILFSSSLKEAYIKTILLNKDLANELLI